MAQEQAAWGLGFVMVPPPRPSLFGAAAASGGSGRTSLTTVSSRSVPAAIPGLGDAAELEEAFEEDNAPLSSFSLKRSRTEEPAGAGATQLKRVATNAPAKAPGMFGAPAGLSSSSAASSSSSAASSSRGFFFQTPSASPGSTEAFWNKATPPAKGAAAGGGSRPSTSFGGGLFGGTGLFDNEERDGRWIGPTCASGDGRVAP